MVCLIFFKNLISSKNREGVRSRCLACPVPVGAHGRWGTLAVTVRFGILLPVNMKITVLLDDMSFSVVEM
jgi:hypothetical protein